MMEMWGCGGGGLDVVGKVWWCGDYETCVVCGMIWGLWVMDMFEGGVGGWCIIVVYEMGHRRVTVRVVCEGGV